MSKAGELSIIDVLCASFMDTHYNLSPTNRGNLINFAARYLKIMEKAAKISRFLWQNI